MNTIKAYAKINLSLIINNKTASNMHSLDSIITSIDLADTIFITPRVDKFCRTHFITNQKHINIDEIDPTSNSCLKACELMVNVFDIPGVDIVVMKNIPLKAGVGGSSADAAAVIKEMCRSNGINVGDPRVNVIANECGSDVYAMIKKGFKRLQGIGDKVIEIETRQRLFIVLAMGANGISTKECFSKYDELVAAKEGTDYNSQQLAKRKINSDLQAELERNIKIDFSKLANDLTEAAIEIEYDVLNTMDAIKATEPLAAIMTGSGAMCYGVYEDAEKAKQAYVEIKDKCELVVLAESV